MSSVSLFEEDKPIEKDLFILIQKHFQTFSYNEEQKKFIEAPLTNIRLLGIPGGGKTQSVIGKILFHYLTGDFQKNTDYIILTFSKRTNLEFLHKGMNIFDEWKENFFHTKNVRTIHSLASKLHYDSSEEMNTMQDTVIISAIFKIDENPELLKSFDETKDLKVIFVDEAQDLSGVQYDFIMCLSHHLSIPVIMIGDPNQNIYQFQKGSDKYLLNHTGFTYHLIQNYRSTPSIITLINYFRPWSQLTPRMIAGKEYTPEENSKPIFFTGSIEEILKNIVDEIRKSPYPRENIAIIGPVKKSKPILDTYKNIGLSLVVNKLKEEKILFKKHYEDSIVENHFEESLSSREEGYVNLYTVHGAKGLEFDQVFLINFHTTTFGIMPTEEKFREYKYLWYVGLSRAKKNLRVYIDEKKIPWYDLKLCPNNYFKTENKKLYFPRKIEFREDVEPNFFELSSLMKNKNYIDEEVFYQFEKLLSFKIKKESLFELDLGESSTPYIHKYKEYQPLYTLFLNQLFIYFYELKHNRISFFIENYQKMILNTIVVPKQFTKGYKELKVRIPNIDKNLLLFGEIYELKNSFKWNEEQLLNYLYGLLEGDMKREFFMFLENDVFKYPKTELEDAVLFLHVYKNYNHEEREEYKGTVIRYLFQLSLFIFQSEYELGTLWVKDFKEELESMKEHIEKMIDLSQSTREEYQFHVNVEHPKLPIVGEVMMKKENTLIDLKFSKTIQKKHIYELIILSHMMDIKWEKPEIEIWNFYHGEKVKVVMDYSSVNIFILLQVLSNSIKKKFKNMIFILDIEVIGEEEDMDMIQIHMEEMTTGIVISTGYIFPEKMENIYKYYNCQKVLNSSRNIDQIRDELEYILEVCDSPIIISHNVETIDKKMFIKNNIFKDFSKIKWIDTRQLLKFYMEEEIAKEEIFHIYDEFFEGEPIDETDNKNQVFMLKKILTDVAHLQEKDILSLSL